MSKRLKFWSMVDRRKAIHRGDISPQGKSPHKKCTAENIHRRASDRKQTEF
jgi:hypothetical protein